MRIFIGFKWETVDKEQKYVPVQYGDMSRQVAALLRENSENKIIDVPKMSCYINSLKMDRKRLSDSTFVSKVHLRERRWSEEIGDDSAPTGNKVYENVQGGNYTVERLMPTPFMLSMKMDLWTSNTDQKLQIMEQILVLFNPSLEIQSTDNYLDWSSLTTVDLEDVNYTSKSLPQGVDTQLDICTLTFELPIWINPPAKVKKLGIIKHIISNVFTEQGSVVDLPGLAWDRVDERYPFPAHGDSDGYGASTYNFAINLIASDVAGNYEVTMKNPYELIIPMINNKKAPAKNKPIDWEQFLEAMGGFQAGDLIAFKQPGRGELVGTFAINPINPNILSVQFDPDTLPENTSWDINGNVRGVNADGDVYESAGFDQSTAKQYVDLIIDPLTFNPMKKWNGLTNIPYNTRLLILDDIGDPNNADGADAWAEYQDNANPTNGTKTYDLVASADSIIAWNGTRWVVVFDPNLPQSVIPVMQNMKTLIKYRYTEDGWVKAFEGEYEMGTWKFIISGY